MRQSSSASKQKNGNVTSSETLRKGERHAGDASQSDAVPCAQAVLSVPLRGVSLAPLRSLLRPQPGLAAFAPPPPPPSGAALADRQSSDPSNVRVLLPGFAVSRVGVHAQSIASLRLM